MRDSNPIFLNLKKYSRWAKFSNGVCLKFFVSTCVFLLLMIFTTRFTIFLPFSVLSWSEQKQSYWTTHHSKSNLEFLVTKVRHNKFVEVPQIVWGLNNQKIALARAALTARFLNRTLLMPSLSTSLFYKKVELLQPIAFDKIFNIQKFNSLCSGFIQIGRVSDTSNLTKSFDVKKGSGRTWTIEKDLNQLEQCKEHPIDGHEVIRIDGKNPFLWHDHWLVTDYAKVFECLVFVDEIIHTSNKVISKIREKGLEAINNNVCTTCYASKSSSYNNMNQQVPYIAVHMRVEKDWMIHCKKREKRSNISQICSKREEIMERVGQIHGIKYPVVVYLAVADSLLEDDLILSGWKEGLLPFEKKKLGVWDAYKKHPYLVQSAIDFEVCVKAEIFVGNSFSTFSSLVVFERSQKLLNMGYRHSCTDDDDVRFASYAYNVVGESGSKQPQRWMTNMSDSSLLAVSYGTNQISCLR